MICLLGDICFADEYDDTADGVRSRRVYVTRADPRIRVSGEVVRLLRDHADCCVRRDVVTLAGDVLTIDAENGRWVYQLVGPDPDWPDAWIARWPD